MDLAVVGAGYVGAVTAACLAGRGHAVTILESNAAKAAALQGGSVAFFEPGLAELVAEGVSNNRTAPGSLVHRVQKLTIGLASLDLVDQELHRLDWIQLGQGDAHV